MQDLILHLLKSAGLISLFYLGYFFLLKNDTSFRANRFFLLTGIFTSLLLPFLEITRTVQVETTAVPVFAENFSAEIFHTPATQPEAIDWWQVAGIIYLIGLSFFLLKFLIELLSLLRLIYTSKRSKEGSYYVIQKCKNTQPFSFFKWIVVDPDQHTPTELEMILKHEKSHAQQWHSIDQVISSLCVYLLWFNPFAWLYRKSLVQNLEFLADKEVVAAKVSKKEYQKTLLKISVNGFEPALSNQFYQSLIKKRIMMLNKNTTPKSNFWKTSLLLPFLAVFIFSFNVTTEAQEVITGQDTEVSKMEVSAYVTKDSEEKELRALENLFEKQGVELKFNDLKYSKGLLTNVAVSFRKMSNGKTGNLSLKHAEGISPLLIYTDGEKVVMTPKSAVPERSEAALAGIGNAPLYIIAGKHYKTSELVNKYVETKGTWSVIKPKEAIEEFGRKAKDGAIIISESNIVEDFKEALKDIDLKKMNIQQTFIQVNKDAAPILMNIKTDINTNPTPSTSNKFELQDVDFHAEAEDIIAVQTGDKKNQSFHYQETKPLVFIDGVEQDSFSSSEVNPATIKTVKVLKGEDAVEKYGKRAESGVVEIELKSEEELKATTIPSNTSSEPVTLRMSKIEFKERKPLSVRDVGSADPDAPKPLYIVNGKEMDKDFDVNSIAVDAIKSITVLKDDKAIEKYGEKASKGVIEIITKK